MSLQQGIVGWHFFSPSLKEGSVFPSLNGTRYEASRLIPLSLRGSGQLWWGLLLWYVVIWLSRNLPTKQEKTFWLQPLPEQQRVMTQTAERGRGNYADMPAVFTVTTSQRAAQVQPVKPPLPQCHCWYIDFRFPAGAPGAAPNTGQHYRNIFTFPKAFFSKNIFPTWQWV